MIENLEMENKELKANNIDLKGANESTQMELEEIKAEFNDLSKSFKAVEEERKGKTMKSDARPKMTRKADVIV